jgi:hypothetical protein
MKPLLPRLSVHDFRGLRGGLRGRLACRNYPSLVLYRSWTRLLNTGPLARILATIVSKIKNKV